MTKRVEGSCAATKVEGKILFFFLQSNSFSPKM